MRLATLKTGGRDGTLVVVTPDGDSVVVQPGGVPTLQAALDDWASCEPRIRAAAANEPGVSVAASALHSPLPRAYQWCDGSTYLTHMIRIRASRGMDRPPRYEEAPLIYQGGSDGFLAPTDPITLGEEDFGLDLEATVAIVTDDVPRGTSRDEAPAHIKLVMLTNDLTFRHLTKAEFQRGYGVYQSKPARAYAPYAVTPDELGDIWDGCRLHATVRSWVNGDLLGELNTGEGNKFDFSDLIAYLARTRNLAAGTIIGSGTVSNEEEARGFGCLAEKRAVEIISDGEARTEFLRAGDTVRIEVFDADDRSLFGALDQRVALA
jgi:fumarylacetoacetate (FAA) hydrolase